MSELTLFDGDQVSPFDSIRDVDDHGNESWSARNLMGLMAYASWQKFLVPLERAMATARNQGHDVGTLFIRSVENSGGRPREDYQLSRFAAYLTAMNGDPNKPEVAAAQAYFAIRAREAEIALPQPQTKAEMVLATMQMLVADVESERARADRAEKQLELEAPLVAKAIAHSRGENKVVARQDFARSVITWAEEKYPGSGVRHQQVFLFLSHIGLFVSSAGHRGDAGHATTDAIRRELAFTHRGTAGESGYQWATGKLTVKGQDFAWRRIEKHMSEHGTLALPRKAVQR